jgi:hypothetical protein
MVCCCWEWWFIIVNYNSFATFVARLVGEGRWGGNLYVLIFIVCYAVERGYFGFRMVNTCECISPVI